MRQRTSSRGHRARTRLLACVGAATLIVGPTVMTVAAQDQTTEPEALVVTPSQAEGPYYPVELPMDRDSDLTVVEGAADPALGEVLQLEGELVTVEGQPIEGATVEIWQTDANGVYLHPADPDVAQRDEGFQGFGESSTDAGGEWAFRTILPEVYGSRPRHIHAKVKIGDETVLTTQIYFGGGDIPEAGAVALTGTDLDALIVEAFRETDPDGTELLTAHHRIVLP